MIESVIGTIIGYFSDGSSEESKKRKEIHIGAEEQRRKWIRNHILLSLRLKRMEYVLEQ